MRSIGENRQTGVGHCVQQRAGYRAFIPVPLPPDPPIGLTLLRQVLLDRFPRSLDDELITNMKSTKAGDAAVALRAATLPTTPAPKKGGPATIPV